MSNSFELYIELLTAKRKASDLEKVASKLRRLANHNMSDELNNVSKNWRSPNASKFLNKGTALRERILAEAKSIENDAEIIRRIAQRVYDSEMEALSIAKKRSYNG